MLKKLIFSVVIILIVIFALEMAANLLENSLTRDIDTDKAAPGWQTRFFTSFLDWHEPDPALLWRYKPNLENRLINTNSDHLLGSEIPETKDPSTIRILLLGDSSPVGLGLKSRQQAFGEILKYLLELEYLGNRKFELINAAVSGYTSEQIKLFLTRRGWQYQPDLVILYCGNNDASISGPATDRELIEAQNLTFLRQILSKMALYRVLRGLLAGYGVTDINVEDLILRVPRDHFQENLADIAGQCRSHNCPLIILKPPVPLLWPAGLQFKLFRHLTGRDDEAIFPEPMLEILGRPVKYCINKLYFDSLYGQTDPFTDRVFSSAYEDSLPPGKAIEYYTHLAGVHDDDPIIWNNLGVSYWQIFDYDEAEKYLKKARELYLTIHPEQHTPAITATGSPFCYNLGMNEFFRYDYYANPLEDSTSKPYIYLDSARQADYFSLRIKRDYWQSIDSFQGTEGVYIIDLPKLFRQNGGEILFIDHCHPTPKGHQLIAQQLAELIRQKAIIKF